WLPLAPVTLRGPAREGAAWQAAVTMERQQLFEGSPRPLGVLRAVQAGRLLLEFLDIQRQTGPVRVSEQVERHVDEADFAVDQRGRPGDIAVPALQLARGRVDLQDVV